VIGVDRIGRERPEDRTGKDWSGRERIGLDRSGEARGRDRTGGDRNGRDGRGQRTG
jgi:hypothetical protein